jgi:hypothetical protein
LGDFSLQINQLRGFIETLKASKAKEVDMGRLDGKVALISGGARGQGATEARMFAQEGACVVFGDILDNEGRQVEAQIRELGGEATYVTWT